MTKRTKIRIVLGALLLVVVSVGVQALRWWWYYGYSRGTRTGVLRKISLKGSPLCRYVAGELVLQGQQPSAHPEVWKFTIDEKGEDGPLMSKLRQAERSAKPVTLTYRQDKDNIGKLWVCHDDDGGQPDYYVTDIQ